MSTITATGWSGLVNDVHQTTYETVGEFIPEGGKTQREMQRRGNYSLSKLTGASVQLSRAVIDAAEADDVTNWDAPAGTTWNDGTEGDPSDATGQGTVDRINVPNSARGGARTDTLINTVPVTDATGESMVFDTVINHAYAADESGNGGEALAKGTPNAAQP